MEKLLFSVLFTPTLLLSGTLSLAPFRKLLSRKQLSMIYVSYGILLVTAVGIFLRAALSGWASFALVKHALLAYSLLATVIHILILPHYFREWIFSAALATLFFYLIGAVAAFLAYCHYGWDTIDAYTHMELIACIMILLFYWPIRRLIVKTIRPFLAYGDLSYWHSIFLIPVAMLCACYFMLPGNAHMETLTQVFSRLFMVLTGFFICHSVSADFIFFQEKQAIEEQLRQQKLYYSAMQQNLEDARRQRHDFKHHLITIQHYIETDNKDGLREYCGELQLQNETQDPIIYSGNGAADGVIYYYRNQCMQKDIRFLFQGSIHSDGIADTDLCVILGNALDNALTGCMTVTGERFISVTVRSEKQLLSLVIQNSFDGTVEEREGKLLSRKRKDREGVGLRSMRTICRKYGGMMEHSWEGNIFRVSIYLPLPEQDC